MPSAAYLNPLAFDALLGIDRIIWQISHLFADMKFMNIFSMLFGAGVLLFCQLSEQRSGTSIGLHYRRNFWLLVFGLIHGHLIWYGDVLYSYAMCAFLIYWARNLNAYTLIVIAVILLAFSSGFSLLIGFNFDQLTEFEVADLLMSWNPGPQLLGQEISAYQGSYFSQLPQRSEQALMMETDLFINVFVWRVSAMMMLGMALFKWEVFSLQYSKKQYLALGSISFLIGFPLVVWGMHQNLSEEFSISYSLFIGSQYNYWGSILVSMGYISLLCLWLKSSYWPKLKTGLANVGRMAFTHYIFQSVVFTLIFYGHGLGLFAEVSRLNSILMVIAMWLVQLWISSFWLQHFRYGPLEWSWRCLTYGRLFSLARHSKVPKE